MKDIFIDNSCPYCQYKTDAAAAVDGDSGPSPGDISICWSCLGVSSFDRDLKLVKTDTSHLGKSQRLYIEDIQKKIASHRN